MFFLSSLRDSVAVLNFRPLLLEPGSTLFHPGHLANKSGSTMTPTLDLRRQIKKALGSLDSLRVGLLPPEEVDAVDAVSPTLSTSSKDDRKDPEDDLFHEPL